MTRIALLLAPLFFAVACDEAAQAPDAADASQLMRCLPGEDGCVADYSGTWEGTLAFDGVEFFATGELEQTGLYVSGSVFADTEIWLERPDGTVIDVVSFDLEMFVAGPAAGHITLRPVAVHEADLSFADVIIADKSMALAADFDVPHGPFVPSIYTGTSVSAAFVSLQLAYQPGIETDI